MGIKMGTESMSKENENRRHIRDLFLYVLFVGIMVLLVGTRKMNYHIDEMYSYGLSNYAGGGY